MDIKTKITRVAPEAITDSKWTGGVTRQIAIWPPEAEYAKRDFEWRLSSATVDLEESTFTSLPGFHRILMILDGKVGVTHKTPRGERHKDLGAFDQDSFDGGWETTSVGRCVDFNLMLAEKCGGSVSVLSAAAPIDIFQLVPMGEWVVTEAFYCLADSFSPSIEEGGFVIGTTINKGGALLLQRTFPEANSYPGVKLSIGVNSNDKIWGVRATIVSPF
ncbi:hypothetical protein FACS1894187_14250 [Synergistales bacterium]|nr:hypothetical protein FACS1894187_14250 [Synergistales bacterium]